MLQRKRKAQGILEYTLLLGAIVAVIVVVLMSNGGVGSKVRDTYTRVGNASGNTMNAASEGEGSGVFNGL